MDHAQFHLEAVLKAAIWAASIASKSGRRQASLCSMYCVNQALGVADSLWVVT